MHNLSQLARSCEMLGFQLLQLTKSHVVSFLMSRLAASQNNLHELLIKVQQADKGMESLHLHALACDSQIATGNEVLVILHAGGQEAMLAVELQIADVQSDACLIIRHPRLGSGQLAWNWQSSQPLILSSF